MSDEKIALIIITVLLAGFNRYLYKIVDLLVKIIIVDLFVNIVDLLEKMS